MTNTHNLDENASEFFEFILGGNNYRMRYPNAEEAEEAQKLENEEKRTEWLYNFIEPVSKEAPPIREALKKINVKKMVKFNQMVISEFSE